MNHTTESTNDPETIRSEIDQTRERMDQTIDALSERVKGRHLLDELLGFFRSSNGMDRAKHWKDNVAHSTNSALHSVAGSIKENPAPALLIGAGIAWMIYQSASSSDNGYSRRRSFGIRGDGFSAPDYPDWPGDSGPAEDPVALAGEYWGASGDAPATEGQSGGGEDAGEGTSRRVAEGVKAKVGDAAARVREKGGHLRERSREWREHARERSHELYESGRQQVTEAVHSHPLSVGLGALAVGIVAGLLIPAPRRETEALRPHAQQLRDRAREAGRDLAERGRHVKDAAVESIKEEAKHQGLTAEGIKEVLHTGGEGTSQQERTAGEKTSQP